MDKLILTEIGGFPLKLDDFLWQNGELDASNWGMYDAIQAHLLTYGSNFIVEGCAYAAPNITAGWIMLDGELMRVDAHAGTNNFFVRTQTFDARGSKTFKDTSVKNTYEKIRGVLSGASGSLNITTALRLQDKQIQLLATSTQQFSTGNIPVLDASKITTGTFADARIPSLAASKITTGIFDPARIPAATETAIGGVEKATAAEMDAGTADKFPDAALIIARDGGTKTKYVEIGDWNMVASGSVNITLPSGVTYANLIHVRAFIRSDTDQTKHPITHNPSGTPAGYINTNSSAPYIVLVRTAGGYYDTNTFDSTGYNRGWVIFEYI